MSRTAVDIHLPPATIDGLPAEPRVRGWGDGWLRVSYLRDGLGHDPDDGRPAVIVHRPDGSVALLEHRRAGRLHDPGDGRPAYEERAADGTRSYAEHYHDGARGGPVSPSPSMTGSSTGTASTTTAAPAT